jgi:hypothetical protein
LILSVVQSKLSEFRLHSSLVWPRGVNQWWHFHENYQYFIRHLKQNCGLPSRTEEGSKIQERKLSSCRSWSEDGSWHREMSRMYGVGPPWRIMGRYLIPSGSKYHIILVERQDQRIRLIRYRW